MNFLRYSEKLERDIKYQCFNYKDCQSKKKEFEIERDDNEPKKNLRLAYIDIKMGNRNLEISTPPMVCLFGFNRDNSEICLQFSNLHSDNTMNNFFNYIQYIEFSNMRYIGLNDNDNHLYNNQIRNDKNEKYEPYLVVKVPFRYNKYEIDIKNKDNENISILNIYNFTSVKCDIYVDKIWKYNDRYICKWKVRRILIL